LNEIWTEDKMRILHFACSKYFTYHLVPVLTPNYKQHILSPAKVRNVCYSSAELYAKSVYLNLFGWRGHKVHEKKIKWGGGQAMKVWEPLL
jgi:hypothetical protein